MKGFAIGLLVFMLILHFLVLITGFFIIFKFYFTYGNADILIRYEFTEKASAGFIFWHIFKVVLVAIILGIVFKVISSTKCFQKLNDLFAYNPMILKCGCCFWKWGIIDMNSTNAPYEEIEWAYKKKKTGTVDSMILKKTYAPVCELCRLWKDLDT